MVRFLFRRILFNFLHKGFKDLSYFLNIVFLKTSCANAIRTNLNTHLEEIRKVYVVYDFHLKYVQPAHFFRDFHDYGDWRINFNGNLFL